MLSKPEGKPKTLQVIPLCEMMHCPHVVKYWSRKRGHCEMQLPNLRLFVNK